MTDGHRRLLDAQWERRFAELEEYIRAHGSDAIPKSDRAHEQLRRWLQEQRRREKAGSLNAERRARLAPLMRLGANPQHLDERWRERFEELRAFRERSGHCRVPFSNKPFARWVQAQRDRRKRGVLLPERVERLESLGFEWLPPPRSMADNGAFEERWQQIYACLVRFRQEHGHTDVPRRFPAVPRLGEWVKEQRHYGRSGRLHPARRARLDAIGFVWSSRWPLDRWEKRFAQLLAYRERFGHCRVPQKWKDDVPLGRWVEVQRQFKRKGRLSPERIQRLDAIGFQWAAPRSPSAHGPGTAAE